MPITSGMATCWGLLELVGLGLLGLGLGLGLLGLGLGLGLLGLGLVGLGLVGLELVEGAGLPDLVGLLGLGELLLVGTITLRVRWGPGMCLRAGGLVLPGAVDE